MLVNEARQLRVGDRTPQGIVWDKSHRYDAEKHTIRGTPYIWVNLGPSGVWPSNRINPRISKIHRTA